ncbi:MAG: molybdopterin converting factor subunit 1, partial [Polyangiaceae bacterium]
ERPAHAARTEKSMKLEVLYFAAIRDLIGADREAIVVPEHITTIGVLSTYLSELHPALEGRLAEVRFARNEEFARAGDSIAEGDTIALIPPVAGG